MRSLLRCFSVFFSLLWIASCRPPIVEPPVVVEEVPVDTLTVMDHLYERGVVKAATNCAKLNYRLLEGRPAGFHFELLDDFSEELGLDLQLEVNDSLSLVLERLLQGDIDLYAGVFDTLVTDTAFRYFVIDLPVATGNTFAWVIPRQEGDTTLDNVIEEWLDDMNGSGIRKVYHHYFSGNRMRSDSAFRVTDRICRYDELIRTEAERSGWDWRLLAAIIYQESRFKPDLENPSGAYGLMQLMPRTMEKYGIDYDSPVEDQIAAGVKLLSHFQRELPESIADSVERMCFTLASYNAGMGHILEARKLALKHGRNPDVWTDNVELHTPRQTYFFVKDITQRYQHYQALIQ